MIPGSVRVWLRVEGLAVLLMALLFYHMEAGPWLLLVLLFLAPDLSMFGYIAGPRRGAAVYNLIHSYVLPLVLLAAGVLVSSQIARECALIWIAHIGFDRLLGYGLKYPGVFRETHIGSIGNRSEVRGGNGAFQSN